MRTAGLLVDTYLSRLRGVLGRRPLPPALLLRPANSVHRVGMQATLEVAVLDEAGKMLATTTLSAPRGGRSVLEAPVGSVASWGLAVGGLVSVG